MNRNTPPLLLVQICQFGCTTRSRNIWNVKLSHTVNYPNINSRAANILSQPDTHWPILNCLQAFCRWFWAFASWNSRILIFRITSMIDSIRSRTVLFRQTEHRSIFCIFKNVEAIKFFSTPYSDVSIETDLIVSASKRHWTLLRLFGLWRIFSRKAPQCYLALLPRKIATAFFWQFRNDLFWYHLINPMSSIQQLHLGTKYSILSDLINPCSIKSKSLPDVATKKVHSIPKCVRFVSVSDSSEITYPQSCYFCHSMDKLFAYFGWQVRGWGQRWG